MYLQALFAVVVATTLGLAWLQLTALRVTIAARQVGARYATAGLERAQSDLMQSLAVQIAGGNVGGPFAAPTAGPAAAACANPSPCSFQLTTSALLAGTTQAPSGAQATNAGNVVAANQQQNLAVGEQRIAAVITATVTNLAGATVASATRRLVLRTFAAPPYVALSAADEATAENSDVGDFAGTCDGSVACGGVDNRIHALLRCADLSTPDNCAGVPDLPADTFADNRWQNLNAQRPSWSR